MAELELLADLYVQADSYLPALEVIGQLLSRPEARTLSLARRTAIELKAVSCRLAQGESQAALGQCRELLQHESEIESLAVRARLRICCADALFRMGRLEESQAESARALEWADACGDLSLSASALNQAGRVHYRLGNLPAARDHYEHALALFRRLGDEASAASVRNNLGLIHKNLCEWEAASAHLRAALRDAPCRRALRRDRRAAAESRYRAPEERRVDARRAVLHRIRAHQPRGRRPAAVRHDVDRARQRRTARAPLPAGGNAAAGRARTLARDFSASRGSAGEGISG